MLQPKVSIVIPSYNRAKTLARAVMSVLNQPYANMEVIVVDDASHDDSERVVQELNDGRIRYIKHDHNKGAAESRNTGIRASEGEYIAFQDSDDLWADNRLSVQVEMLESSSKEVGAVFGRLEKRYKDGKTATVPSAAYKHQPERMYEALLDENFITPQVFLARASAVRDVGEFDGELDSLEDWDFAVRFAQKYHILFDDRIVAFAAVGEDSLTANRPKRLRARERMYMKHHDEYRAFPRLNERMCARLARGYAYQQDGVRARRYAREAFRLRRSFRNAVVLGTILLGTPVFFYAARWSEVMRRRA